MEHVSEPVRESVRPRAAAENGSLHPLLHRWFVEYNPAYFASALCLLAGIFLISDGMGGAERRSGELWLFGVVQLYESLLIGGAAFLFRVLGQRRPAVILAIVEMVYLLDPTMQTEVAAYMESSGLLVSLAWLVGLLCKVRALGWALRIDLSRSAVVAGVLVAAGVAGFPHLFYAEVLDGQHAVCALAFLIFGAGVVVIHRRPRITSRVPLDEWGRIVLGRVAIALVGVWGALLVGHAAIWIAAHELWPGALACTVPLLIATSLARREVELWFGVCAAIALSLFDPWTVWATAAMAAVTLLVRGRRGFLASRPADESPGVETSHPYRTSAPPKMQDRSRRALVDAPRSLVGAVACGYLAAWTCGWEGGAWPQHLLWLDALASAALLLLLVYERTRLAALPLVAIPGHLAAEQGMLPSGGAEWGAALVGAAFVLFAVGLAISWRLRDARES